MNSIPLVGKVTNWEEDNRYLNNIYSPHLHTYPIFFYFFHLLTNFL